MLGPRTFLGIAQPGGAPPAPPNPIILGVTRFEGFNAGGVLTIPVNVPAGVDQLLCCFSYITGGGGAATVTDLLDAVLLNYLGPGATPPDGQEFCQFWNRANPIPGIHTIQVDTSPNQQYLMFAALLLAGVNVATPFGTVFGGFNNPAYPDPNSGFGPFPSFHVQNSVLDSAAGDMVIDCLQFTTFTAQPPIPVETPGAGQAEIWRVENEFSGNPPVMRATGSQKIATGANTAMIWDIANAPQELRLSSLAVHKL